MLKQQRSRALRASQSSAAMASLPGATPRSARGRGRSSASGVGPLGGMSSRSAAQHFPFLPLSFLSPAFRLPLSRALGQGDGDRVRVAHDLRGRRSTTWSRSTSTNTTPRPGSAAGTSLYVLPDALVAAAAAAATSEASPGSLSTRTSGSDAAAPHDAGGAAQEARGKEAAARPLSTQLPALAEEASYELRSPTRTNVAPAAAHDDAGCNGASLLLGMTASSRRGAWEELEATAAAEGLLDGSEGVLKPSSEGLRPGPPEHEMLLRQVGQLLLAHNLRKVDRRVPLPLSGVGMGLRAAAATAGGAAASPPPPGAVARLDLTTVHDGGSGLQPPPPQCSSPRGRNQSPGRGGDWPAGGEASAGGSRSVSPRHRGAGQQLALGGGEGGEVGGGTAHLTSAHSPRTHAALQGAADRMLSGMLQSAAATYGLGAGAGEGGGGAARVAAPAPADDDNDAQLGASPEFLAGQQQTPRGAAASAAARHPSPGAAQHAEEQMGRTPPPNLRLPLHLVAKGASPSPPTSARRERGRAAPPLCKKREGFLAPCLALTCRACCCVSRSVPGDGGPRVGPGVRPRRALAPQQPATVQRRRRVSVRCHLARARQERLRPPALWLAPLLCQESQQPTALPVPSICSLQATGPRAATSAARRTGSACGVPPPPRPPRPRPAR